MNIFEMGYDGSLQTFENTLLVAAERHIAIAQEEAGDAKDSALAAAKAAESVVQGAARAKVESDKAILNANNAAKLAANASDLATQVEEKYAPRHLSAAKRAILIALLKHAPFKPSEPIFVNAFIGATDGAKYGAEIADAINDPSTGWKAKFGSLTTLGSDIKGVRLVIQNPRSVPRWGEGLHQALQTSGIGGEGVVDASGTSGSTLSILVAPKN